ncbi:hypothetical protein B0H13DRAFT_2483254 [Mycena leptocephala]|nr:hypothetical protein B0H13DRAFT_2483254 [Mycena leptocephala]
MLDIEILNDDETGAPAVRLHGDAKTVADDKDVSKALISLGHSETVAIVFTLLFSFLHSLLHIHI